MTRPRVSAALEARVVALLEIAEGGDHECALLAACPTSRGQRGPGRFAGAELELVEGLLEAGRRAGCLVVGDPHAVALRLEELLCCYSPPRLFERDRARVREELRAVLALLIRGLLAREPRRD